MLSFHVETEDDSDDSDIIILPDEPKSPQQTEEDDYNNRYPFLYPVTEYHFLSSTPAKFRFYLDCSK